MDCKEIQPVHSKGDQSWVFTGRTDAKAETPILCPPHAKSCLKVLEVWLPICTSVLLLRITDDLRTEIGLQLFHTNYRKESLTGKMHVLSLCAVPVS